MEKVTRSIEWKPILEQDYTSRALDSVRAIANHILPEPILESAISIAEQALLFSYLSLFEPSNGWDERALNRLNVGIERICMTPKQSLALGLHGGLAGLGWLVQHVIKLLTPPEEYDEDLISQCIGELDQILLTALKQEHFPHGYDLISGLVGLGTYWVERLPNRIAYEGLCLILAQLEGDARELPPGITWFTPPESIPKYQLESFPLGYYNLGVAHGVPGIIRLLLDYLYLDVEKQRAMYLLEKSIAWLLAQERSPDKTFRFSSWVAPGYESGDSRLGWCYGDLGIATILAQCGRNAEFADCEFAAERLFDSCSNLSPSSGRIQDAALCHGAFGVAHIFNRAYQTWSNGQDKSKYRDVANYWFEVGLSMRRDAGGVGGYQAYRPDTDTGWLADPSFLGGGIGVALALLSAATGIEPRWDRLMLLSGSR